MHYYVNTRIRHVKFHSRCFLILYNIFELPIIKRDSVLLIYPAACMYVYTVEIPALIFQLVIGEPRQQYPNRPILGPFHIRRIFVSLNAIQSIHI